MQGVCVCMERGSLPPHLVETPLEQFGPALKLPWTKLKAPKLSNRLIKRLVQGTKKQSKGRSVSKISNIRDEYLVNLLQLRKKYEKKLR